MDRHACILVNVHPRLGVEAVVARPEQLAREPRMNNLLGNNS
jgi:hypothetical protein